MDLSASAHRRGNNHNGGGGARSGGRRGRSNHDGSSGARSSSGRRRSLSTGLGVSGRSLSSGRDGTRHGSRLSPGSRDSGQSAGGDGHGADGRGSWDDHGGDLATARAVGDSGSTADDGLDLSLGDGAGAPSVRSLGLAVARVNVVPLVVAVVVTAVHGDVVRRVPDVGAARRRRGLGAAIRLDGDTKRKVDVEAHADVDVDEVTNLDAELER